MILFECAETYSVIDVFSCPFFNTQTTQVFFTMDKLNVGRKCISICLLSPSSYVVAVFEDLCCFSLCLCDSVLPFSTVSVVF